MRSVLIALAVLALAALAAFAHPERGKTASQAMCSTWDPFTNPDPPGCDWFTRPEEPKQ